MFNENSFEIVLKKRAYRQMIVFDAAWLVFQRTQRIYRA